MAEPRIPPKEWFSYIIYICKLFLKLGSKVVCLGVKRWRYVICTELSSLVWLVLECFDFCFREWQIAIQRLPVIVSVIMHIIGRYTTPLWRHKRGICPLAEKLIVNPKPDLWREEMSLPPYIGPGSSPPILVLCFNNGIIGAIIDIQVNNIYLRVYLFLAYNS